VTELPEPPPELLALAEQRAQARAARDFGLADILRDRIAVAGWTVRDTAAGWQLAPRPPYDVVASVAALPDRTAEPDRRRATVALLVEGWPDDLRRCVAALLEHTPEDVAVAGLDLGNVDGAGDVLHELAKAHAGRIEEWHVAGPAGWGAARGALLRLDPAAVHVMVETSTILTGDAITPVLAAFDDPTIAGVGWQGANVNRDDAWRSLRESGPGEVDALLGYLFAVRRRAALAVGGPHPKARFYRNADVELSLALRAGGGRLVALPDLPVRQERHRGYHDSDPVVRDRESKRTYDRLLQRFRGRDDILAPHGD
jgi:hypothetical protein